MSIEYRHNTSSQLDILYHLQNVSSAFVHDLSNRVDVKEYSQKLFSMAEREEAWSGDNLIGLVAYYINHDTQKAFITNVSVDIRFQKQGIATTLLENVKCAAVNERMKLISLEAANDDELIAFYLHNGFSLHKRVMDSNSELIMHLVPMVVIRCTVYNHEPYLRDCLEGFVMQQTNFPFVAIVHDDASTDNSAAIIREYEEKYPNIIKPIYEKENQWRKGTLTKVMNTAIEATDAKYVAMCEGDDYWTDPLKLQKQVDFMEANEEYGLCYTDYSICDSNGELMEESLYMNGSDKPILTFEEHLFRQGYIAPMTWLYRKDVYESITNNMLKGVSDGSYVVALEFFYNSKVAFLQINTATYRVSQGSASRPLSLQGVFKYRKGVYKIEREYAKKYLRSEWIDLFIIRQEIYELYPIAKEINEIKYLDWCENIAKKNPLISLYVPQEIIRLQKEVLDARSSHAYRLGKFILAPFKKIKQLFKL